MRCGDSGCDLARRGVGAAVFHAVDDRATAVLLLLEPVDDGFDPAEPGIDALPAGGDEVDEKREVVDARIALGQEVALERRQAADELVRQAA